MNSKILAAKELQLELSGTDRTLYFHGESMRPFLVEGDEVVVEPISFDEIRVGDVVTYRFKDRFPTRRVVRKFEGGMDLWCENWPARRFQAESHALLGIAVARRRQGEWITYQDREWIEAERKALRAHRRIMAKEWIGAFPGRVVRKLGKMLGLRRG